MISMLILPFHDGLLNTMHRFPACVEPAKGRLLSQGAVWV